MRIRLLGAAAGGGVPQWNCNCAICREARAGTGRVKQRTQSAVAISADSERWFLLNASPDVRAQIESFPPLRPSTANPRNSPIQGILLTNADLDHSLGLLLLREGEKLIVHTTDKVRQSLTEGISIAPTLEFFCGIHWGSPLKQLSPLFCRDGSSSGLLYQAIELRGKPPRFMKSGLSSGDTVGYRIVNERDGGRLLFLPDVGQIDETLRQELADCDMLLFDGTFWSENEMNECGAGNASAASMGHVPISGPEGSLKVLASLKMRNKIYIHINNTNPVLREDSQERAEVVASGCAVGWDGMEMTI